MSTIANLPTSAKLLTGQGNAWQGSQDSRTREETFTWSCPWADSNDFYAAVVGLPTTFTSNGYSYTRTVPLRHPYNDRLYAVKLSWAAQDGSKKPANAPFATVKFSVTFGYPGFDSATSDGGETPPFLKITAKSAARIVTDISKKYTYTMRSDDNTPSVPDTSSTGSDNNKLEQNVGRQFGGVSYQFAQFAVPDLSAWQSIVDPLVGKVNSQIFQMGNHQINPGHLLLEGYGFDLDVDMEGHVRYVCTTELNYSELPWNSIFIKGGIADIDPQPYETSDLMVLYSV